MKALKKINGQVKVGCEFFMDCEGDTSLISIDYFIGNLSISPDANANSITSNPVSITLEKIIFRTDASDTIISSASTSCTGCICNNAIVEVDYTVYTNSTENGIKQINANIVVENTNSCSISQIFTVRFFTNTSAFATSGNPGYIIGLPVLSGTNSSSGFSIDNQFILYGASTTGACTSDPNPYSPIVLYKQDVIFSCYNSLSLSDLTAMCTQDITTSFLFSSNTLTHIAKFGNIHTKNADD